ncbi:MFS transporter [Emticicia sp. SJ17W-69]|uniref:MFS transporter n=1 Tax=Emticicia sp. SJ17W-69 TaxID=3421657 RepID=UPI003EB9E91F
MENKKMTRKMWFIVLIASFGYFVDLYDLTIFANVRVESLLELNIPETELGTFAISLMNWTVVGFFIGGIFWGRISDIYGRKIALIGIILTFSIATIANAFIQDIAWYKALRFFSGFGLAGEMGVGLALIKEVVPPNKTTLTNMIFLVIGMFGAVIAGVVALSLEHTTYLSLSGWRWAFIIGGVLGIILLFFRSAISESILFEKTSENEADTSLLYLLSDKNRRLKMLYCILAGLPAYYIMGFLIPLSKEFGEVKLLSEIKPAIAVMIAYFSLAIFDIFASMISIFIAKRIRVIQYYLAFQFLAISIYLYVPIFSSIDFYFRCALLGASVGFWGLIVMNATEQFGTNLRGTVASIVPNVVRGLLFPLTEFGYMPLKNLGFSLLHSAFIVAFFSIGIAFYATTQLKDKFENNADYIE